MPIPRVLRRIGVVAVVLIAIAVIAPTVALLVLTRTSWGHDEMRTLALKAVRGAVHGTVNIGTIEGDLINHLIVSNVTIADSSGAPLVHLARASVHYRLIDLLHKRLDFTDVSVDTPTVVLTESQDSVWNYRRIFPTSSHAPADTQPGWGSFIRLTGVRLVAGDLTVRSPWRPDSALHGRARDSAIAVALDSSASRVAIVRAPDGFVKTIAIHDLSTRLAVVRLEDPATTIKTFEVASMRADIAAFRPPDVSVRDVVGTFYLDADSLWWKRATVQLPASRAGGPGVYQLASGDMHLALHADTVALADMRFLDPQLPTAGAASGDVGVRWRGQDREYSVQHLALHTGTAQVTGHLGLSMGAVASAVTFHDVDLRFQGVDTRLITQVAPAVQLPRQGIVSGRAAINGPLSAMSLKTDVTFDEGVAGTSRMLADGEVGFHDGITARHLAITLEPLQVALAMPRGKSLPIGGTISGHATLDGSTTQTMSARADLVQRDGSALTHVVAGGDVVFSSAPSSPTDQSAAVVVPTDGRRTSSRASATSQPQQINLVAHLRPLDLTTVGRFMPAAQLYGQAAGDVRVTGSRDDLQVHGHLGIVGAPDSSGVTVDGHVYLGDSVPGYNLTASATVLDAHALSHAALPTSMTATLSANGRGMHPESMATTITADVRSSDFDSVTIDTLHLRAAVRDGQLHIDTAHVRALATTADISGSLGLADGHSGALTYRIATDSLPALKRFLPRDSSSIAQHGAALTAAIARARSDSAHQADSTDVQRAIEGLPPPRLVVDTPRAIRRDTLAGHLVASGTVQGQIHSFELRGTLDADSLIALGNETRRGHVSYQWTGGPSLTNPISATVRLDTAIVDGFAVDSLGLRVAYHKPDGTVHLTVGQDSNHIYNVVALVHYTPTEKSLRYDTLALRLDTTRWQAPHAASIDWSTQRLAIHNVELVDGHGGRIVADGTLPAHKDSSGNLHLQIRNLDIGDIAALTEAGPPLHGQLALDGEIAGSLERPRLNGNVSVSDASVRTVALPTLFMRFGYDTATLATHLEMAPNGSPATPFAVMDATVPIDLSSDATGSRLLDKPLGGALRLDSLPLDVLPQFETAVTGLAGRVSGRVTLAGTTRHPEPRGTFAIDGGTAAMPSTGTSVSGVTARVRMTRDSVVIDSMVAVTPSTGGNVHLTGSLDRTDPTVSIANLTVTASDLRVINNRDRGRLDVDANLTVAGPLQTPYIYGSTTVHDGVLYVSPDAGKDIIDLTQPVVYHVVDTTRAAVRDIMPSAVPLMSRLLMDVDVSVNRDTWVRNDNGNVEAYTERPLSVHTDHARHVLVVNGTVNTDVGDYSFMGKRFTITKGMATFIGGRSLNPTLSANGEYDVPVPGREALAINISITGNVDSLRLALSSNSEPPISQSDLLSYLAFSMPTSGLTQQSSSASLAGTTGNGGIVGTAGTFVENQLAAEAVGVVADQLKGNLARALDADVLNITTGNNYTDIAQNRNNAAATFFQNTQLEFGKYFTPRTFVSFQASVAPGARVVHRIGEGLSVQVSGQPLYLLGQPTLTSSPNTPLTGVLGLTLVRTWKF